MKINYDELISVWKRLHTPDVFGRYCLDSECLKILNDPTQLETLFIKVNEICNDEIKNNRERD